MCNGDTPLPRRRYPQRLLALATLAAAFAHLSGDAAHAQSPGASPFEPQLSDPRNAQRFSSQPPTTRATAPSPPATPSTILPPSGAGETGFDSTGAVGKKKKARRKPGDPKPPPPPPPPAPGPPQAADGHTIAQQIPVRRTYADAYKPADALPRRPAPPIQDPYEPLGIRAGTFLLKPSIEVTRGQDSNPARSNTNIKASGFTTAETALNLKSEWSRHEYKLDLRGRYTDYDSVSASNSPFIEAKGQTRIDVTRDTQFNTEGRFLLSTDYPGSPNLPVGFSQLPIFTAVGTSAGLSHRFNHLELSGKLGIDQTTWQDSKLTDGTTSSNKDRDYTQYSASARATYEVFPGVRPFVEVGGDTRQHELQFDRDGYQRDSRALTPKVGTTFEIVRKLTGEVSVGYLKRQYDDPRLQELRGIVFDASLKYEATGLTTVTLTANSRGDETVVAGWSGALRRDMGVQVDHAFRRWLIGTVRAGYGLDDYIGSDRADQRVSLGAALTYKFNREFSLKGEYRYDQLRSNVPGASYDANAFLIGLKLQR